MTHAPALGPRIRRPAKAWLKLAPLLVLAGCTFTGNTFKTAGLDCIVVGRTTLQEAAECLGAQPTDTWQQGQTVLARWGYKGSLATDAVYFRQEAWLRFGPDGTFQRMEHSTNLPVNQHPLTAEEADRRKAKERATAAAKQAREAAKPRAAEALDPTTGVAPETAGADRGDGMIVIPPTDQGTAKPVTIPAPDATDSATSAPATTPLLPAGTRVIPSATYPIR